MNRLIVSSVMLAATTASAGPASLPGLLPLPQQLSARCAPLAQVPASATIPGPALAARVSVANCIAEEALNALALRPDNDSIARLDGVVIPAVTLLENVRDVGGDYWRRVAADAERDLYVGMIVRERTSVPDGDVTARNALEPMLQAWQDKAAQDAAVTAQRTR
jgi:hypothetical protein